MLERKLVVKAMSKMDGLVCCGGWGGKIDIGQEREAFGRLQN